MLKWVKKEAGEYESFMGRFHVLKTWDRIYGDHWQLRDRNEEDYYKGLYHQNTLMECKLMAEAILERERKNDRIHSR